MTSGNDSGLEICSPTMRVLSSIPTSLIADPITEAPAITFLPYVDLGWLLLMIAVTSELRWARVAATVVIVMSLLTLPGTFHDTTTV